MCSTTTPPSSSTGIVYRYVGADTKTIDISTIDYASDPEWVDSGIPANTFKPEPANNKFESNNRNVVIDPPEVHGGGWLSKKTIITRQTINVGLKDFFTHTLRADYPISVEITRGASSPDVTVNSAGGIKVAGNIQARPTGTVSLSSTGGSILSVDSVAVYAASPTLVANGEIDLQLEGNRGTVNALAGKNISLTAISKDNVTSRIAVGAITSTGGRRPAHRR